MEKWEKKDKFKERFTSERMKEALSAIPWGFKKLSPFYKRIIFFNAIISVVPTAVGFANTVLTKEVVNSAVARNVNNFNKYLLIYILLSIFNFVFNYVYNYFNSKVSGGMVNYMRKVFYKIIFEKEYGVMEKIRVGELLNRLQNDIPNITSTIYNFPKTMVSLFIQLVGSAVLIFKYAPEAGLAAIPVTFIMALSSYFISKRLRKNSEEVWKKSAHTSSLFVEHINNMMLFHTFGREDVTYNQVSDALDDLRDKELETTRIAMRFQNLSTFMMLVITLGSMVYFLRRIIYYDMSFGAYTMLLSIVNRLQGQIGVISGIIPTLYTLMIASRRAIEIEEAPNDMLRDAVSDEEANEFYDNEFEALGMRNISFSYPQENREIVLKDFSLEIKKQEFVAITGISGSGKSTMQKLLLGLYRPNEGEIYLKTHHGEEELDSSWRALFSYVPQRNLLLFGTIRDAIAFGEKAEDGDEGYWQALRIACAEEFVKKLPEGLDTTLGEKGTGLSEGQVQRIAIARAIYSNRPILILDECTSSLDGESEKQLLINLKAMTDKTVIIVTHRPAALDYCDREVKMVPVEVL